MVTANPLESLQRNGGEENNIALMVIRILVCVVGVIGNIVVIFVIVVLREYKKAVTHWYVLQLAIADSIFLLTLPFKVVEDAHGEWIFSGGMCKAKEAILFLNYYCSVLFLTVLSIDRYIAVCQAMSAKLQRLRTKFSAYTITVVVWMMSLCLCAPGIVFSDKYGVSPNCKCQYEFPSEFGAEEEICQNLALLPENVRQICSELSESKCHNGSKLQDIILGGGLDTSALDYGGSVYYDYGYNGISNTSEQRLGDYGNESNSFTVYQSGCTNVRSGAGFRAYILFNFIVMFVFPFVIISACYLLITLQVRETEMRLRSHTNDGPSPSSPTASGVKYERRNKSSALVRAERSRLRVTCVCFALVVLFLVCWLPFHSVHLAKMHGIVGTSRFCGQLSTAVSLLAYLNSAINPYVYNFVATSFFKRLRSAGSSVRTAIRNRTSALSISSGWARYEAKKPRSDTPASNTAGTAATRISEGKNNGDDETEGQQVATIN